MSDETKMPWEDGYVDIPPFETGEDSSFPEGLYLFAFGKITPIQTKEGDGIEAVTQQLWVLKREDKDEKRIRVEPDGVKMGAHGVLIVERFPNPTKYPNLAWRGRAFYSPFKCLSEIEVGDGVKKKVIDWKKVQAAYGTLFKVGIVYSESKKNGKRYRNFDYESLVVTEVKMPRDQLLAVEETYNTLKAEEKAKQEDQGPDTGAPF